MSDISREFNAELFGKIDKIPRDKIFSGCTDLHGRVISRRVYSLKLSCKTDYRKFVPKTSNGFTQIDLQYLNQSIEEFIYSVLLDQATTRISIVDKGAGSLESQGQFRLVEDSVINYSIKTWS